MNRKELKQLSKSQLKGHWKVPVLLMLAYCLVALAISTIQNYTYSGFGVFICFLITLGLEVWAFVGLPNFYLKFIEKKGEAGFEDVLVSKGILLKSLGYLILMSIIGAVIGVVVGLALVSSMTYTIINYSLVSSISWSIGLLILVVAIGLIVFELSIAMTGYILVDKENIGVFEALGLSMKMMKGYKWQLFVIYLSFIGWGILCIFTLGIGYLWLSPYMTLTMTNFYKALESSNNTTSQYSEY